MSEPLVKLPTENRLYDIPFAALLPAGQSIGSVDSVTQEKRNLVPGSIDLVLGPAVHSDATVQMKIGGGTAKELYKLSVDITDTAGQALGHVVELFVFDLGWVQPVDVNGTYANLTDMVDRFGLIEMVELTDRLNIGRIDGDVILARLADATGEINGYVGKRYDLPLGQVPQLLMTMACDLARYKLHKDGPPDFVIEANKAAVQKMRDIAAGNLILEVGGVEPPKTGGVAHSSPGRVFTHDTLKDF